VLGVATLGSTAVAAAARDARVGVGLHWTVVPGGTAAAVELFATHDERFLAPIAGSATAAEWWAAKKAFLEVVDDRGLAFLGDISLAPVDGGWRAMRVPAFLGDPASWHITTFRLPGDVAAAVCCDRADRVEVSRVRVRVESVEPEPREPRGGDFVDCHTHVIPSGDDGARSPADALRLCRIAAGDGTSTIFGTPHVSPSWPLTRRRRAKIRRAHETLSERAPLAVELGFEVDPQAPEAWEDPAALRLGPTPFVLVEPPEAATLTSSLESVARYGEAIGAAGLRPLLAHAEKSLYLARHPRVRKQLIRSGWRLQITAQALVDDATQTLLFNAWDLLLSGAAEIVASDGHSRSRPPTLAASFAAVRDRMGGAAEPLYRGGILGPAGDPSSPVVGLVGVSPHATRRRAPIESHDCRRENGRQDDASQGDDSGRRISH
jgi:protein-tyrosine phosphatase